MHNGSMRNGLIVMVCAGLATSAAAQVVGTPGQPLRLLFQERPPYTESLPGGGARGLVATPAEQALTRAGIAFRWEPTPSQRQLVQIQTGQTPDCGLGWFRNPEREKLGKFSRPLYRDQAIGALVRADTAITSGGSAQALLADKRWRLLTKEGFSYGAQVDGWLATLDVNRVNTGAEPAQLVLMLLGGRADWMFIAPEEAQPLLDSQPGQLRLVAFQDVGPGQSRHLYCSRHVPDSVMAAIDQALGRMGTPPPGGVAPR